MGLRADVRQGREVESGPRFRYWPSVLVIVITAFVLVALDLSDGTIMNGDVDDLMRALQVKDLLATGRWFDLSIPQVAMPGPYITPWSRLVDLPYATLALFLQMFTTADTALRWSFLIWPPAMLAIYCALVALILKTVWTEAAAISWPVLVTVTLLMAFAVLEFSPGRIDHHNVQMLLLLVISAGLSRRTMWGGVAAGIAGVLSAAVGLETVPLVAAAYGAAILMWIFAVDDMDGPILGLGLSTLLGTPLAALLLRGPQSFLAIESDVLAAPLIAALVGFGLILCACIALSARLNGPLSRGAAIALPGMALVAALLLAFPMLLNGPYQMIDPALRHAWFAHIYQEMNILIFFRTGQVALAIATAMLLFVLVLGAIGIVAEFRSRQRNPWIVLALASASILCTLASVRFLRFAGELVPFMLPFAIAWLGRTAGRSGRAMKPLLIVLAVAVPITCLVGVLMRAVAPLAAKTDMTMQILFDDCAAADFGALNGMAPGRVLVGPALGLEIARRAPQGLTVSSVSFHRAAPGISRTLKAFETHSQMERRQASVPFDYIAVCRPAGAMPPGDAPLYQALISSSPWPGVTRIDTPDASDLLLYRIDHSTFR